MFIENPFYTWTLQPARHRCMEVAYHNFAAREFQMKE